MYIEIAGLSNAREAAFKALELKNNWGEHMNLGNIYVAGANLVVMILNKKQFIDSCRMFNLAKR